MTQRILDPAREWSGARIVARAIATSLVLTVAACSEISGPDPDTRADAEELTRLVLAGASGFTAAGLPNGSVDVELPCPAGGSLRRQGSHASGQDGEQHVFQWDFNVEHRACAFETAYGRLVTDGSLHTEGSGRIIPPAQNGGLPTIVALTSHQAGTMTTTHRGRTTTCATDVTQTFEAASNSMRLVGTVCGNAVDILLPVNR